MSASPLPVWRTTAAGFAERFAGLAGAGLQSAPDDVVATVQSMRRALSAGEGTQEALVRLVKRHDWGGCRSAADLEVSADAVAAAADEVPATVRELLEYSAERIRQFHRKEADALKGWSYQDDLGNEIGLRITPVARAAVYAPGGTALYPTSVLMSAIPARVAGVGEVHMLTPPGTDGAVSPVMLHAAAVAGVDRVFRVGGAQGIFAAAYGVDPVPQADVIVGPGNAYVAEAKRQAFGTAGIDSIAGPSEVAVIADGSCPPEWVAADLVAQAEHDLRARAILLTTSEAALDATLAAIADALETAPRRDIIAPALASHGCAILANSIQECIILANRLAPEHLQLMVDDAESIAGEIRNAGAIFVGPHSPTVLGDYCAGTNHVLPTAGGARHASMLGVHAFMKRTSVLCASVEGAAKLSEVARRLALEEQLPAHARAAALRAEAE